MKRQPCNYSELLLFVCCLLLFVLTSVSHFKGLGLSINSHFSITTNISLTAASSFFHPTNHIPIFSIECCKQYSFLSYDCFSSFVQLFIFPQINSCLMFTCLQRWEFLIYFISNYDMEIVILTSQVYPKRENSKLIRNLIVSYSIKLGFYILYALK